MPLLERIFHRRGKARERRYHNHYCRERDQTKLCDPFKDDPRPLVEPRARRLSVSPPRNRVRLRLAKATLDQDQSPFFSQLPFELRNACYAQMLCEPEGTIHIYPKPGKYTYTRCQKPDQLDHQQCWAVLQNVSRSLPQLNGAVCYGTLTDTQFDTSNSRKTINLNILITCRKMYAEAIDILYAGNAFSFGSGRKLTVFLPTVLPHRFDAIRRLSFNWTFYLQKTEDRPPYFNSQRGGADESLAWNALCSRIAGMPHLRQLRCGLRTVESEWKMLHNPQFNEEREKDFLEPLKQISKPDLFEVVLRWEQLPNSITKSGNFPFTIFWRYETAAV